MNYFTLTSTISGVTSTTHICVFRHVLTLTHLSGLCLVHEEPAVASLIIFLMCAHCGFTPFSFWLNHGPLEHGKVHVQKTRACPLQSPNQWAIRFPLIYSAWRDADFNQSHFSVTVFLLIASVRCGCTPFYLWSLSANEVRKAYGSCSQSGSTES